MDMLLCIQLFASTDSADERCYALVLGGWEKSGKLFIKRVGIVASMGKQRFPSEKTEVWIDKAL
jgi:hypothetical protein